MNKRWRQADQQADFEGGHEAVEHTHHEREEHHLPEAGGYMIRGRLYILFRSARSIFRSITPAACRGVCACVRAMLGGCEGCGVRGNALLKRA
jgi:hypothetical protein